VIPQNFPWAEYIQSALLTGWVLGFAFVAVWSQSFRCPRCGEYFCRTWWYNKSFLAGKCVHCGLKKYADG
jgi:hypothetical protein